MTIGFDCLPIANAAQHEGIPKGNWNKAATQFYAEKTFGIPKGTDEIRIRTLCCFFASNQSLLAQQTNEGTIMRSFEINLVNN